jgi:hypothetical protein
MSSSFQPWQPGLHDPSLIGWLLVGVYLISSIIALRAAFVRTAARHRFASAWWLLVASILFFIGVNKELDLHVLVLHWLDLRRFPTLGRLVVFTALGIGSLALLRILFGVRFLRGAPPLPLGLKRAIVYGLLPLVVSIGLRFGPSESLSGFLTVHPLGLDSGVWHIHLVELLELTFICVIAFFALRSRTKVDPKVIDATNDHP